MLPWVNMMGKLMRTTRLLTIEFQVDIEARLAYGREEHTKAKAKAIRAQSNNNRNGDVIPGERAHVCFRER